MRTLFMTRQAVDDGAMADRDEVADDARELPRHVQHGVVLHVRVAAERDIVVLIPAQNREGPDRGAGPDRHVADHGSLRVDGGEKTASGIILTRAPDD